MMAVADTMVLVDGASRAAMKYAGALMSSVSPWTVSCVMRAFLYASVMSDSDSTMKPSWTFLCSSSSVNRAIVAPLRSSSRPAVT
jgi:hypothetical protein